MSNKCRVTTHLENLEKSGNSKVVRETSGKVEKVRESKSAEIWLFAQLKYQYHKAVVSYIHAQIICTKLNTYQYPHITNSKTFAGNEKFAPCGKLSK